MSQFKYIGDLFEAEPDQYGLRGDTYLWQEMRAHFTEVPLSENASGLKQQVEQAFLLLTGQPMSGTESLRVERFAHGGISSGRISRTFWRERALPLLMKRWLQEDAPAPAHKPVEDEQTSRKVAVSIQTTGLFPAQGDRAIEIAAVEIVNRQLTGRSIHTYLNPNRSIDPGATAIHGITAEFLEEREAPEFECVASEFLSFVRGAELIMHNAQFHVDFLNSELVSNGNGTLESICPRTFDTLQWARTLRPKKNNTLVTLCKAFKIKQPKGRQCTEMDAQMTALVYLELTR
jgi:DNA polymerase-3 subunit epsilon